MSEGQPRRIRVIRHWIHSFQVSSFKFKGKASSKDKRGKTFFWELWSHWIGRVLALASTIAPFQFIVVEQCFSSVFRLPIICIDWWLPSCSSEGSKPRRNVVTSTEQVLSSLVFCSSFSLFNWSSYSAVKVISGRRSAHYFIVREVVISNASFRSIDPLMNSVSVTQK